MGNVKLSKGLLAAILSVALFLPGIVHAGDALWRRQGRLEIFGILQPTSGASTSTDQGVEIEFKGTTTFGVGVGYSVTDFINLNGTILWGNADLETDASTWGYQTSGDSDLYFMDFNVDVNFMKRRFTPVLSAGIGSAMFVGYAPGADLDESNLSWNIAGGVRWDALDHLLIKALFRATWTDLEQASDGLVFSGLALSVGYLY